ncbi:hypothetical protein RN22_17170 [Grimontia sp. AD028]|nr:hypothetical protein RN22_17170 [Grimontia sp. AD028]
MNKSLKFLTKKSQFILRSKFLMKKAGIGVERKDIFCIYHNKKAAHGSLKGILKLHHMFRSTEASGASC